jgi:hypothetical protein
MINQHQQKPVLVDLVVQIQVMIVQFYFNQNGSGIINNRLILMIATDIITNPIASNINILALPGQREPFVTIIAMPRNYGLARYLWMHQTTTLPIPEYLMAQLQAQLSYINVQNTATSFDTRPINNTFVAAYFPDVVINDPRIDGKRLQYLLLLHRRTASSDYTDKVLLSMVCSSRI